MQQRYQSLIDRWELRPHPEGGYFRETYRSSELVNLAERGARSMSTAILFLLPLGQTSALHRIKSDELWHFYAGAPLRVVEIASDGARLDHVIGPALHGFSCQAVVRSGNWFGAYVDDARESSEPVRVAPEPEGLGGSLVGCTVAPGFDFADFELAERRALVERYPQHRAVIERLTR